MGDWFSPKDAFQHRHCVLARIREREDEGLLPLALSLSLSLSQELGLFFISLATLPTEQGSARLLTPVEYPSSLCIEVFVPYLAHPPSASPLRWSSEVNILPGTDGIASSSSSSSSSSKSFYE